MQNAESGLELWVSDGTEEGTKILKDIYPGPFSSLYGNYSLFKSPSFNRFLFKARSPENGLEVWVSDGTSEGTELVVDVNDERFVFDAAQILSTDNNLFVLTSNRNIGVPNLFEFDTDGGNLTSPLEGSVSFVVSESKIIGYDGSLYFNGQARGGDIEYQALSVYKEGVVHYFRDGPQLYATKFKTIKDKLFFVANGNDGEGTELWYTEGALEGTKKLKDIATGIYSSMNSDYREDLPLIYFDERYFFTAWDLTTGYELWVSDLSDIGTKQFMDIMPGSSSSTPSDFFVSSEKLFFKANTDNTEGLWVVNKGAEVATFVKNVSPSHFFQAGSEVYFLVEYLPHNYSLWKTDGTDAGTIELKDLGYFYNIIPAIQFEKGLIYVAKNASNNLYNYYLIDNQGSETTFKHDQQYYIYNSVADGNYVYYFSNNSLWLTDGQNVNQEILNVSTDKGIFGYPSKNLTLFDGSIFFNSYTNTDGQFSLWRVTEINHKIEFTYKESPLSSDQLIDFGSVDHNSVSDTQTIRITNSGHVDWAFYGSSEINISGDNHEDFIIENTDYPQLLTPGEYFDISIHFVPQKGGVRSAQLNINSEDNFVQPYQISLQGTGISFPQTIIVSSLNEDIAYSDVPIELSIKSTSGLPVTLESSDASTAEIIDGKLITKKSGSFTITASQEGNEYYLPAESLEIPVTIVAGIQTISLDSKTEYHYGDPSFELKATVSSGNPVSSFTSSDESIIKIDGVTASILKAGQVEITVFVAADDLFASSEESFTITINQATQTITFNPLPEKTYGDTPFELTATASSGLDVTFSSSDVAVASVEGVSVTILKAGSATITASQVGNDNYSNATATQTLTINKAAQTITFEALTAKTIGDEPFVLSASSTSGLAVAYASSDATVAKVDGTTVTLLKPGSAAITASQTGNENYLAAASVEQSLTVNKAVQTITFEPLAAKTYGDPAFELSAASSVGLLITFTSSDPAVVSVEGNSASIVKAGAVTITASQAGNDNYNAASAEQTLTIAKASQTITFGELPTLQSDDEPIELAAEASSGLPVAFQSEDETIATIDGATLTITGSGATSITATQGGDDNYLAAVEVVRTLVVEEVTGLRNGLAGLANVYPNPAQSYIEVKLPDNITKGNYRLTQISGQVVKYGDLQLNGGKTKIVVEDIGPGVYLLNISGERYTEVFRVIKN
ncbi:choice-of-anchor D domain-containing protein [Imperialibacter sp.]|uniref:choice-of-anchor D domain-containing protein n=1 Tax=Imperialibacter sp. TaxID=2038411 RepID=UPI0032EBA31B